MILKEKIAICLWIYHISIWEELLALLKPNADIIKVYIGLCTDNTKFDNFKILQSLESANIEYKEYYLNNYGADMASFLTQLLDITEQYFIKLHSKKSLLGNYKQINWRAAHFDSLIGNKSKILSNIEMFEIDNIGLICNKHFILCDQENTNQNHINELFNILEIESTKITKKCFSAGTMFMSRTQIFKKYLDKHQQVLLKILHQETQKINDIDRGTYAHSLERIFGYLINYDNKIIAPCCNDSYIKLQNSEAKNGYFSLITLYNNDCYIDEDINLYGKLIDKQDNYFTIKWLYRKDHPTQKYKFLLSNMAIKNE